MLAINHASYRTIDTDLCIHIIRSVTSGRLTEPAILVSLFNGSYTHWSDESPRADSPLFVLNYKRILQKQRCEENPHGWY